MAEMTEQALAGELTDYQFTAQLESFVKNFEDNGYLVDGEYGVILGNALAIAVASHEFWTLVYPEFDFNDNFEVIHPVVATDLAGAMVGAVVGGVRSNFEGDFSWKSVGVNALTTGIIPLLVLLVELANG